jgi:phage baseplate assembly protein W
MPSTVLRWPLELDGGGRLATVASDEEMWDLRLKALLSTRTGERAMRMTYGCDLPERLFTNLSPTTPEDDIRKAVSDWLPLLTVTDVTLTETDIHRPRGVVDKGIDIEVEYMTPSRQESSTNLTIAGGAE